MLRSARYLHGRSRYRKQNIYFVWPGLSASILAVSSRWSIIDRICGGRMQDKPDANDNNTLKDGHNFERVKIHFWKDIFSGVKIVV